MVDLKTDYQNTELTWLNGTTYIAACQYNDGDSRCHPTLIDFSHRRGNFITKFYNKRFSLPVKSNLQVITQNIFNKNRPNLQSQKIFNLLITIHIENDSLIIKPRFLPQNFYNIKPKDRRNKKNGTIAYP